MTYQVLARKWRPQDFSSVVGQKPIVTALQNALTEGRIAQAYLFSGIRGIGKTSVARILAKALNCEKGPAADPCNECGTCREITEGSDLDVIEVDAATYSKVEQVRELTESLKYGPARDRYKVVVIDEIHRLSRQAFDALLKIVEEPPPHLVFVFATTEIEAVPATILSRCQEFRFRRVPSRELAEHLRELAGKEKIEVSDAGLRLLARAGDGSVRDAVALLDQLSTYGSGKVSDEDAARVLGGVDHAIFHGVLEKILAGDAAGVSAEVTEVEQQGWDPRHVFSEFLAYCRDALHLALGGEPKDVDLPAEEAERLATASRGAGYENLLRLLQQLLGSEETVRRSESGALALEIAWLKAAELPKLVAIEDVLLGKVPAAAGGAGGGGRREPASRASQGDLLAKPPAKGRGGRSAKPAGATKSRGANPPKAAASLAAKAPEAAAAKPSTAPRPEAPSAPTPDPAAAPAGGSASIQAKGLDAQVAAFLDQVSRRKQPLAAHLAEADGLVFDGGRLRIYAPPGDPWLTKALQRDSNRGVLAAALEAVWGGGADWRLVESAARSTPAPQETKEKGAATSAVTADPRVQTVLDIFGGTVESVVEREPRGER